MSKITHMSFSSSLPKRKPKAGDERVTKKHGLQVRQQLQHNRMDVISNGKPVWEWVAFDGTRDRMKGKARYRTDRDGNVLTAPHGWRILESGKETKGPVIYFSQGLEDEDKGGWVACKCLSGEARYARPVRAIAVPITVGELEAQNAANKSS